MSESPKRTPQHERLAVFLGDWRADGQSYGSPKQPADDPKSAPETWTSTHTGRWHTGEFFLIQDERAQVGGKPFDTLGILGVEGDRYFARTIENHGFYRDYVMTTAGQVWTLSGATERATIEFAADGRTQTIVWEWKVDGRWLPLCERVARRVD